MEAESIASSLGAASVALLSVVDAVRNDKQLRIDFNKRIWKGLKWSLWLQPIPCVLLFFLNQSNIDRGVGAYSVFQWIAGLSVSCFLFALIFTLLFTFRPHPARNTFGFLKFFTILFWVGAIGLIIFSITFLPNYVAKFIQF